jgi:hypothetical protein
VLNITQERLLPEGYAATLPKFEDNPDGRMNPGALGL